MRAIILQYDKETQTMLLRYIKWKPLSWHQIFNLKSIRRSIQDELEYRRTCYRTGCKPVSDDNAFEVEDTRRNEIYNSSWSSGMYLKFRLPVKLDKTNI